MKFLHFGIIFLLGLAFLSASEKNAEYKIRTANAAAVSSFSAMLSKTPVLLGKYHIAGTTTTLGTLGESIVETNSLTSFLSDTGNWHTLSPRLGRQGLDHIFIKQDKMGRIRGLMIGETKYHTSPLGYTKDGIQMGSGWISKRLSAMGNRYIKLSTVTQIEKMPFLDNIRKMSVVLNNGREVYFWQKSSQDSWKFSGSPNELAAAQKKAIAYGKYLTKAGNGEITYRSRIFQVKPAGKDIIINILDAKNIDKVQKLSVLETLEKITLKNAMAKNINPQTIAAELKKKMPHFSDKELMKIADKMTAKALTSRTTPSNIMCSLATSSMFTSLIASGLDISLQAIFKNGDIDFKQTGIIGGSVFLGAMAAHGLNWAMNSTLWGQKLLGSLSGKLGYSTSWLGSTISSTAGGFLISALVSYGMYFAGYSDLKSANVNFSAGAIGTTVGTIAGSTLFGVVAAIGTASTGTPIASLSGAAAVNATMAWLGGGSIASGGGGVFVGSIVMGGAVVFVAVATSATVYYVYSEVEESHERDRIRALLNVYKDEDFLDQMLQIKYRTKQKRSKKAHFSSGSGI